MLITVIVPIFNAELYLRQCLDSIVFQKYRDLEIILINDGSTDGSLSICKEYAGRDERIRVIDQENGGLSHARKVGIGAATGEYISFVDADDYVDKEMYSELVKIICDGCAAVNNEAVESNKSGDDADEGLPDIVTFGHVEEYLDHSVIKRDHFEAGVYDRQQLQSKAYSQMLSFGAFFDFGFLPNLVSKLLKKSFLDGCEYHVSDIVKIGEDADLFFQLLPQADSVRIVDLCPYHYRKYDFSMMQRKTDSAAIDALYADLKSSFKKQGIYDVMEKQLEDYITFIRLLKAPDTVGAVSSVFANAGKVALYGAGGFGKALYDCFGAKVSVWVDASFDKYKKGGLPVGAPSELLECQDDYDCVFIAILKVDTCKLIKKELQEKGIKKEIFYFEM